jgi:malate dehydrogenase (oxaloacetate-decarboxylating)(NADP+)
MKIAASHALADLAKEDVPDSVIRAYGGKRFEFGRDYIIPKPFDPRVLLWEAPAVAKAAMKSGVALKPYKNDEEYIDRLEARLGKSNEVMRVFIHKAQHEPKKVVFPEGEEDHIIRAAQIILDEKIAKPILLGSRTLIKERIKELGLDLEGAEFVNPSKAPKFDDYLAKFYKLRQRKGVTYADATRRLKRHNIYGMMMVREGDADGLISGLTQQYPDTIRPALQIVGKEEGINKIAGLYMMIFKKQNIFIADATVNIDPTAEELADIAIMVAAKVKQFDIVSEVPCILSPKKFSRQRIFSKRKPRNLMSTER